MVESLSIIFSKLLEGLAALSAAADAGAAVVVVKEAVAAAWPASGVMSPLTAGVLPAGAAAAGGAPGGALADALGRVGSDVLAAGVLPSAGGGGWFCCCPGTWKKSERTLTIDCNLPTPGPSCSKGG